VERWRATWVATRTSMSRPRSSSTARNALSSIRRISDRGRRDGQPVRRPAQGAVVVFCDSPELV